VLEGYDELKAKFQTMDELIGFDAAHEAMFAAAKVIEVEWKGRVAAQPWEHSEGHYESSIEARYIKSRRKHAAAATVARRWIGVPKEEQPLWYGQRLEFSGHPTARPAFDAAKDRALDAAKEVIVRALQELVRHA
jgi:hypothetical protein